MMRTGLRYAIVMITAGVVSSQSAVHAQDARKNYDAVCAGCHNTGLIGAPKVGAAADWKPRVQNGIAVLYRNAISGTPKRMPPKGGRADLSDADIRGVVDYMLSRSGITVLSAAAVSKPVVSKPAAGSAPTSTPAAVVVPAAPITAPSTIAAAVRQQPIVVLPAQVAEDVVTRLAPAVASCGQRHSPAEDGIHDPGNDGTHALQPPMSSFGSLPRSPAGNRVDWVGALDQKRLQPRWDRNDPNAAPVVMDLNIVREVKGSMPDVVYPHKQHTEWLDCSNCHPSIFVPQKGANQITMAGILLGQQCGVCHGKVAFPVSECRLCHSKKKDTATAAAKAQK